MFLLYCKKYNIYNKKEAFFCVILSSQQIILFTGIALFLCAELVVQNTAGSIRCGASFTQLSIRPVKIADTIGNNMVSVFILRKKSGRGRLRMKKLNVQFKYNNFMESCK